MIRQLAAVLALSAGTVWAQESVSFLDNGVVRIGADLTLGGAITWLSAGGGENMINSHDHGRQIQQSYYSGPRPYGQSHPSWPDWPWNPISSGDVYRNRSRIEAHSNDGTTLYVRTKPLQWALNNVECQCTFDTWIRLDGNVVKVRARLNNLRTDRTQYGAFDQELPAIYTNGPWYHLMTYDGEAPFTGGPVREVKNAGPPWASWTATENWAALVNDAGQGVGVFHAGVYRFLGGFAGRPGAGGPADAPTGYISPVRREVLDNNIGYSYEYALIVGTLAEIRDFAYANQPDARPEYRFERSRAHWTYTNASDAGWPVRGRLRVAVESPDPQMIGPAGYWAAKEVPRLYIRAAHYTKQKTAELFWSIPGQGFSAGRRVAFAVENDGEEHTYTVEVPWEGMITGLRFDPVGSGGTGEYVDVRWISWRDLEAGDAAARRVRAPH